MQLSCYSSRHSTSVIFLVLVLVGVKGVPLPFMDEPFRKHHGVPHRKAVEPRFHDHDHQSFHTHHHHHRHEFPFSNEYRVPSPISNFDHDDNSWDWDAEEHRRQVRSEYHNGAQEYWRYRPDGGNQQDRRRKNFHYDHANDYDGFSSAYDHENFNNVQRRRRREVPEEFNDWESSHKTRVESNSVRNTNTRNPLPLQMTQSETRESLNRPNTRFNAFSKGNQHHHHETLSEWRKFQQNEEENKNPRELFRHYHHHMDPAAASVPPLYYSYFKEASGGGSDRLNDGFRDLDEQFEGQSHKRKFGPGATSTVEASPFPELSVVRFRSSSVSLGDNLEIVRIELDLSDGDENEETKLEEVVDDQ